MNNNKITNIELEIIESYFNKSRKLRIFNNPWKCECITYDLLPRVMLDINNKTELEKFTCFESKSSINSYEKEKLCPFISNNSAKTIAFVLLASSLILGAMLILFYKYNFQIKVFLYSNNLCLWCVKENDIDSNKKYDIFLSFCRKDEEFVMSEILPQLDKQYKVCVHFRDWEIGEWIHVNIDRSIQASRRTIIIMSKHFLKSTWGMREFRTAYKQTCNEKFVRMIIVKYGEIGSFENLDSELKHYLQTNTYVDWKDPYFWKKFFYSLPHCMDYTKNEAKV